MQNVENIVNYIKKSRFGEYVCFNKVFEAKSAETCPLDVIRSGIIRDALSDTGIESLYTHQAESYEAVRRGENVLITTPTASGKSLCYNLPVIEDIYHDRNITALYLFPLKALGRDQMRSLDNFLSHIPLGAGIKTAVVDGDTDKKLRRKIQKDRPNIIFSNPDIIHYSVLPKRDEWSEFLAGLKYIIVDELHTYRGIFGNHVYNLFARFMRLFPNVQIICCSATIGNPLELAETMFGRKFTHIDKNGAPQGRRHFMMISPDIPLVTMSSFLLKTNIESGLKTICFTKSRKQTERIFANLLNSDSGYAKTVSSYRAGFLPEERREIEKDLSEGRLKAVISTSAFELGIDIGGVDCTLLAGYPGSLMSLWQRAGRSGRRGSDSLIILLAGNDALDQYYVKHPEKLYESAFENVVLDTENENVNKAHIRCAAYEKPINVREDYYHKNKVLIDKMALDSALFVNGEGTDFFTLAKYPYMDVDLRMAGDSYTIHCNNTLIATASGRRAYMENFEGAIYMHRGNNFIIKSVDKAKREIHAEPFNGNYYTMPVTVKQTMVEKNIRETVRKGISACFCGLRVTEQLTGFSRISTRTGEKISDVELEEVPIQFATKGLYVLVPDAVKRSVEDAGYSFMGSIHAFEHAMISVIPTFCLAARDDIGGISYPFHPQLQSSAVFMYDAYPGGIGINERVFSIIDKLMERTLELVRDCDCESGCPACIYSPKCGSGNYPLDKAGAVHIMEMLLKGGFDVQKTEIAETPRTDMLVYDIETKLSADEVGGWKNADRMGISVAVVYSFEKDEYETYAEGQEEAFIQRLEGAKIIIGFNNIGFDNKVITGYRKPDFSKTIVFDMLADVLNSTGRRFSLDNLAGATIGAQKTADGLQALEWYRQGRIDLIAEYCQKDVEVTKNLLIHGMTGGFINAVLKEGAVIRIPVSWNSLRGF
ncbi:DEAD/DEAH box helicase [Seleniivibrio woodruffii]|uniref:DEAD/DEAH box helicase n=1 Tax=Seleniivibrio woodruffii TaxID=1078050 RepID=UPI0039E2C65D